MTEEEMLEELREHCDELELINQKVMEENEQLKAKIEKMKCCANCKRSYEENDELRCDVINCLNFDKWELEE